MVRRQGEQQKRCDAHFRVLRPFFYWYEPENEFTEWVNPIRKVKIKRPHHSLDNLTPKEFFQTNYPQCWPQVSNM